MTEIISIRMAALISGCALDLIFGDPRTPMHPIRLIGRLIELLDKKMCNNAAGRGAVIASGAVMALTVTGVVTLIAAGIELIAWKLGHFIFFLAESVMDYFLLAAKSLYTESMSVYKELEDDNTDKARRAVSMIVGRDTQVLDRDGIIKAAVETVAENTSDGVVAPMIYTALFGAAGGYFYKAVNTMDSMVGYVNERYEAFGKTAAKLDDVMNYLPSRITALLMVLTAPLTGLDMKNAWRIFRRDRLKHDSPNSAQTESACAGALNVRLAGDAWYGGVLHKKEFIGDDERAIESGDIPRACGLMFTSSAAALVLVILFQALVTYVVYVWK